MCSFSYCLSTLIQKGFKSTNRGIHIQQFTDISLCVFLKTKQNKSQFELTVGGIQSLHTILLEELRAILHFYKIIYLVHYVIQGNLPSKEQILQPSVTKMLPSIVSQKCPCK